MPEKCCQAFCSNEFLIVDAHDMFFEEFLENLNFVVPKHKVSIVVTHVFNDHLLELEKVHEPVFIAGVDEDLADGLGEFLGDVVGEGDEDVDVELVLGGCFFERSAIDKDCCLHDEFFADVLFEADGGVGEEFEGV